MKNYNKKLPIVLIVLFLLGFILCFSDILFSVFQSDFKDQKKAEEELACFLEYSEGVGSAVVKICYENDGSVAGVAVVCSGANSPAVRSEVIQLVSKSLGVPTNRVYVSATSEAFEKLLKENKR